MERNRFIDRGYRALFSAILDTALHDAGRTDRTGSLTARARSAEAFAGGRFCMELCDAIGFSHEHYLMEFRRLRRERARKR